MSELYPDANRANDVRRLTLLWYSVLPGGIVMIMLALYLWMQTDAYIQPVVDASLADYLPVIFVAALLFGTGLTLFLKARMPALVAGNISEQPFQRVSVATFTLLGAADAPAFIGIGVYLMNPADWLALAIVFYSIAAAMVFKPDFGALLAIEKRVV